MSSQAVVPGWAPAVEEVAPSRALVLGCGVDRLDMDATVARCAELIERGGGASHMCLNAAKVVALHRDPTLRARVGASDIVSADGQSVVWAARLLGDPVPERVTGIDLMHRLLEHAAARGLGVYFLGAKADVLERALDRLLARHPRLRIVGSRHGYFPPAEAPSVRAEIDAVEPDILFVAMSSPDKELWISADAGLRNVGLAVGVGGALDVVAGAVRRAPAWVQRAGLEWLVRAVQEPRRLGPRYAVTNVAFVRLVFADLMRRRRTRRPA